MDNRNVDSLISLTHQSGVLDIEGQTVGTVDPKALVVYHHPRRYVQRVHHVGVLTVV